jgi:hypothetical protein
MHREYEAGVDDPARNRIVPSHCLKYERSGLSSNSGRWGCLRLRGASRGRGGKKSCRKYINAPIEIVHSTFPLLRNGHIVADECILLHKTSHCLPVEVRTNHVEWVTIHKESEYILVSYVSINLFSQINEEYHIIFAKTVWYTLCTQSSKYCTRLSIEEEAHGEEKE